MTTKWDWDLEWKTFLFTFLVYISHINELVLKLVHWPDLAALAAVLNKHCRLTHEATPLYNISASNTQRKTLVLNVSSWLVMFSMFIITDTQKIPAVIAINKFQGYILLAMRPLDPLSKVTLLGTLEILATSLLWMGPFIAMLISPAGCTWEEVGESEDPASCLHYLLPPPRNTSPISRLRSSTPLPRPTSRTKKFKSFINFALNKYQLPK